MEIKDLFSYIGFLIVKLGPLFMVFYFILDSIFQANTKGIMYIIGICITVILTIWFITTKSIEIYEGESVNVAGSGLWLFTLCIIAFTFACFKELDED